MAVFRETTPDKSTVFSTFVVHHKQTSGVGAVGARDFRTVIKAAREVTAVREDKAFGAVGFDEIDPVYTDSIKVCDARGAVDRMNEPEVHSKDESKCNYA